MLKKCSAAVAHSSEYLPLMTSDVVRSQRRWHMLWSCAQGCLVSPKVLKKGSLVIQKLLMSRHSPALLHRFSPNPPLGRLAGGWGEERRSIFERSDLCVALQI